MIPKSLLNILLSILLMSVSYTINAQCSMCRAAAAGSDYANGLNTGILYLLATPFVFIALISFIWFKFRDKFTGNEI